MLNILSSVKLKNKNYISYYTKNNIMHDNYSKYLYWVKDIHILLYRIYTIHTR